MKRLLILLLVLSSHLGIVGFGRQNDVLTPTSMLTPTVTAEPTETPAIAPTATATAKEPISRFGEYEGYSESLYDYGEWVKTSQYVTVRDGTKLAVDIYRPAQDGKAVSTPLPVIWTHHRYHRENVISLFWLEIVLKHGYVIGSVDVRGEAHLMEHNRHYSHPRKLVMLTTSPSGLLPSLGVMETSACTVYPILESPNIWRPALIPPSESHFSGDGHIRFIFTSLSGRNIH